jgi:hypothetical protein
MAAAARSEVEYGDVHCAGGSILNANEKKERLYQGADLCRPSVTHAFGAAN